MQESTHKVPKGASQAVLSRVQLTLHATRRTLHGVSRSGQAISSWSVKTRRAPSQHCRDARVYGHTTTVMLDMSTPPLSPPRAHRLLRVRSYILLIGDGARCRLPGSGVLSGPSGCCGPVPGGPVEKAVRDYHPQRNYGAPPRDTMRRTIYIWSVSYTHLTLPTKA